MLCKSVSRGRADQERTSGSRAITLACRGQESGRHAVQPQTRRSTSPDAVQERKSEPRATQRKSEPRAAHPRVQSEDKSKSLGATPPNR